VEDPTKILELMTTLTEQLKEKSVLQTEAENMDEWYLAFEIWFKTEFFIPNSNPTEYMICWDDNEQAWFRYSEEKGYYLEQSLTQMKKLIQHWADSAGIKTSDARINHELHRLSCITILQTEWDSKHFLNCRNGLYLIDEKRLIAHTASYHTRFQLGTAFLEKKQKTPCWDQIRKIYPDQIDHFERFVLAALYQDFSNEAMYFGVGPTGSGKGTISQLIQQIFGSGITYVNLEELNNDKFGIVPLLAKRMLLNREGTIGHLGAPVVRFLKDVVTHEGPIDVNVKNKNRVNYVFNVWFAIFTNGLPHLPEGTDREAWFRRVILDEYNLTQKRDIQFKAKIRSEADAIFTNMLLMEYTPLIDSGTNIPEYVEKVAALWDYWADPVKRVVLELFEYSKAEVIEISDAATLVKTRLDRIHVYMREDRLKANITLYLERLKIKRYGKNKYINIRVKDEDAQKELTDLQSWVEEEKDPYQIKSNVLDKMIKRD
jgi:phage/plasmid-associated DNA primase